MESALTAKGSLAEGRNGVAAALNARLFWWSRLNNRLRGAVWASLVYARRSTRATDMSVR